MPKHIARLLILIAVIAIAAIAAKTFFTDKSYYMYGNYRGNSVAEIASDVPRFRGNAYCKACHAKQYAEWSASAHNSPGSGKHVKCEVCHGPVGQHPSKLPAPLRFDDRTALAEGIAAPSQAQQPANGKLPVPKDMAKCVQCHEAMPGRPLEQRQVVIAAHAGTEQCTACHNPHSPKINFADMPQPPSGDPGAGKAVAVVCGACHGAAGVSVNPAFPNLAGQHAGYLTNSLQAFKSGKRTNPVMNGMAAGLSDANMQNVAAYFAQASCKTSGGDQARAALGKTKASSCALCHGASGISGNQAWPDLAGQNPDYLSSALQSFQNGSRRNPVMTSVARTLSASDIDNLSAYFASASCK
jgi:cytochrome c553